MSDGHYPPSFREMQSSQEYIAPRHRLPVVPSPTPTSSYSSSSITHAHASSWVNKHNYSNLHENFYSPPIARSYSSGTRAHYCDDISRWSESHFNNSSNISYRDVNQINKSDAKILGNSFAKDDVQQESIDLSSAAHVPAITLPLKLPNSEVKLTSVNGDTNEEQTIKNCVTSKSINGEELHKQNPETIQHKIEVVSVIAQNPLRDKNISHILMPENMVKFQSRDKNSNETSDTFKVVKPDKCISAIDQVESALENMFHLDSRSSVTPTIPSVIVSAQPRKTPPKDVKTVSLETILKSPTNPKEVILRLTNQDGKKAVIIDKSVSNINEIISKKLSSDTLTDDEKSHKISVMTGKNHNDPSLRNAIDSIDLVNSIDIRLKQSNANNVVFPEIVSDIVDSIFEKSANQVKPVSNETISREFDMTVKTKEGNSLDNEYHKIDETIISNSCTNDDKTAEVNSENTNQGCFKLEVNNSDTKTNRNENKNRSINEEITYVEVESELEKMFAGIEDSGSKITKTDTDSINTPLSNICKTEEASLTTSNAASSAQNMQKPKNSSENTSTIAKNNNKKKKSSKKYSSSKSTKDSKLKQSNLKDNLSAESILAKRVPVIHIEGSKENPISVQIINSIKVEEDDVSDSKSGAKRKQGKTDKTRKLAATNFSIKKYDLELSDESWICIFCKLPAYSPGVMGEPTGDLFGPYFIKNIDQSNNETVEKQRQSHKLSEGSEPPKKKKRSSSPENNSKHEVKEQKTTEIWGHENCFIWASGIHLIGSKLVGLEEAVFEALKTVCSHCGQNGASIGCRARHCTSCVHYSCALYTGWNLDLETFISTCNIHKVPD